MTEAINFIEWDAKHGHYLIRLSGSAASQEVRLAKMKASEDMYEALKQALRTFEAHNIRKSDPRFLMLSQALAKAEGK